jgi:hypothetical protein
VGLRTWFLLLVVLPVILCRSHSHRRSSDHAVWLGQRRAAGLVATYLVSPLSLLFVVVLVVTIVVLVIVVVVLVGAGCRRYSALSRRVRYMVVGTWKGKNEKNKVINEIM